MSQGFNELNIIHVTFDGLIDLSESIMQRFDFCPDFVQFFFKDIDTTTAADCPFPGLPDGMAWDPVKSKVDGIK